MMAGNSSLTISQKTHAKIPRLNKRARAIIGASLSSLVGLLLLFGLLATASSGGSLLEHFLVISLFIILPLIIPASLVD